MNSKLNSNQLYGCLKANLNQPKWYTHKVFPDNKIACFFGNTACVVTAASENWKALNMEW